MTGNSLRGQNKAGRSTGAGSSPASLTKLTKLTKLQKTKLWQRLRRLDRKCAQEIKTMRWHGGSFIYGENCQYMTRNVKELDNN